MRESPGQSLPSYPVIGHAITTCMQAPVARCEAVLALIILLALTGCTKLPNAGATSKERGVATVSWVAPARNSDGSQITDLAGYTIYYGTSPNKLDQHIQVPDPEATTYTVKQLRSGTTYYFNVAAVTAAGTKGGASSTVSKAIP
jgi:hypothetical protein